MHHADRFVADAAYRSTALLSTSEDRPLVVQFAANDPVDFAAACSLAAPHCDAVELNLGCPQREVCLAVGGAGCIVLQPPAADLRGGSRRGRAHAEHDSTNRPRSGPARALRLLAAPARGLAARPRHGVPLLHQHCRCSV